MSTTEAGVTRADRPRAGDKLEVTVDTMAFGGAGVARHNGYVLFVRGALPGDKVIAEISKSKRSFAEARAIEIVSTGPDRIEPRAPHPGAPWQVLRYERQLEEKQRQVEDALKRIGGFDELKVDPIVEVPEDRRWRYRNKLEYSFGTDQQGALALGFHVPGRWDLVEDVDDVVLASERANKIRRQVREWCAEQGLTAFDPADRTGFLRNLVVRESNRTGHVLVRLVTSTGDFASREFAQSLAGIATSVVWTKTDPVSEKFDSRGDETLAGTPFYEEELCGLRFRISPDAFFQTNTDQAEKLYGVAEEFADLSTTDRLFDLYCGIGTIGLSIGRRAAQIAGLELAEPAIKDARANARLNEIDHARFAVGDVRTGLRELTEQVGKPTVTVIDPPRAGLSQKVVRRVLETEAKRIVYVSCNPTTLAPNARQMVEAGYELKRVKPVDMFPHTPHIECVAVLDRS